MTCLEAELRVSEFSQLEEGGGGLGLEVLLDLLQLLRLSLLGRELPRQVPLLVRLLPLLHRLAHLQRGSANRTTNIQ